MNNLSDASCGGDAMRALTMDEMGWVVGGQNVPTQMQLDHRYIQRFTSHHGNRIGSDFLMQGADFFGSDIGMTTTERELALSERFSPSDVTTRNGVGYSSDGRTTLYDDDGDGAWDSALQTGADGSVYEFGPNGWHRF